MKLNDLISFLCGAWFISWVASEIVIMRRSIDVCGEYLGGILDEGQNLNDRVGALENGKDDTA